MQVRSLPTTVRWAAALFALQAADLATTAWAISNGATEGNPLISAVGWPAAVALKFAVAGAIVLSAHRYPAARAGAIQLAVCLYLAVILVNTHTALSLVGA